MNKDELQAIKERAGKATPGPYTVVKLAWDYAIHCSDGFLATIEGQDSNQKEQAEFFANSITDIPSLIAEVERLQAMVDAVNKYAFYVAQQPWDWNKPIAMSFDEWYAEQVQP